MTRTAMILALLAMACAPSAALAQTGTPVIRTGVVYDVDGTLPTPQQLGTLDLYRPAPPNPADASRIRFPDHPRDVAEAVVWLHRHARSFGGDRRRIAVIGHSAGAHLIALVATDPTYLGGFRGRPPVIRGFVPLDAGVFDIAADLRRATPARRTLLTNAFGTPAEEARDPRWAAGSMNTHADPGDPRALIVNQRRRGGLAARYAAGLGGAPDAQVLLLDKTHTEINRDLGAPGDASPLTPTVLGFVRGVLG